jgi:serine/threonine protein kinase
MTSIPVLNVLRSISSERSLSSWSPESLKSPDIVSLSHDMWGVGVLYYRFLTGNFPFNHGFYGVYGTFSSLLVWNYSFHVFV